MTARRLFFLAVLATLFTAYSVKQSLTHGRLLFPPTEDDAAYFTDAARRLLLFYQYGFTALLKDLFVKIPHSPVSTLMAWLAFAVCGLREWAPHAANGLWVFAIAATASCFTRKYPLWLQLTVLATVLLTPITMLLVNDFRPDGALGLELAIGVLLFFHPDPRLEKRRAPLIGLCFGLALLTKPSGFLYTLAIFGLSHAFRFFLSRRFDLFRRSALVMAAIAAPYFVFGAASTFDYFRTYFWGPLSDPWSAPLPLVDQLAYYTTGPSGGAALGSRFYLFLLILVGGQAFLWFSLRPKRFSGASAALALTAISWLTVTVTKTKSFHFGQPFQLLFLFVALWQLERLWDAAAVLKKKEKQIKAAVGVLGVSGVMLGLLSWPPALPQPSSAPSELEWNLTNRVLELLAEKHAAKKQADETPPSLTYISVAGIPRTPRLQWFALKRRLPLAFYSNNYETNIDAALRYLDHHADFVLAANSDALGVMPGLNSTKIADRLLERLRGDRKFQKIAELPDGRGKAYYLFQRLQ